MAETFKIGKDMFVAVSYLLICGDNQSDGEAPEVMEEAPKDNPFKFAYGQGMVLEMFEKNLEGKKAGEKFDFIIDKKDAYGEYEETRVVDVDKKIFMVDGAIDPDVVYEGNIVPMMDAEGHRMNGVIQSITENNVKMDFNHPLAGEDLHFVGEVLEVRPATEEELAVTKHRCKGGCGGGGCHGGSCGEGSCGGSCEGGCGNCKD